MWSQPFLFKPFLKRFILLLFFVLFQSGNAFSTKVVTSVKVPLLPLTAEFLGERLKNTSTHWSEVFSGHRKTGPFLQSEVGKLSNWIDQQAIKPMTNSNLDNPRLHELDQRLKKLYGALVHSLLTDDRHQSLRQNISTTVMGRLPDGSTPKLWIHMQDLQADNRLEYHLYPWLQDLTQHGMYVLGTGTNGRTLLRNAQGEVIGAPSWIKSGPHSRDKLKPTSSIHQGEIRDKANFEIGEWVGNETDQRWVGGYHSLSQVISLPNADLKTYRDYLTSTELLMEADKLLTQKSSVLKELLPEHQSLIDEIVDRQKGFRFENSDQDFRLLYQAYESHACGANCNRGSRLAPLFSVLESSSESTPKAWSEGFSHLRKEEDRLRLPGLQAGSDHLLSHRLKLKENLGAFYQENQKKIEEINMRGLALQFTRLAENLPTPLKQAVRQVFKEEKDLMSPSLLPEVKVQQAREFASINPQELQKILGQIQKASPFPRTPEGKSQQQTYNAIQNLLQWQVPLTQWNYLNAHRVRSAL